MPAHHPPGCRCAYHGGGTTQPHSDGCPRLIPSEPPLHIARAIQNRDEARSAFLTPQGRTTAREDTSIAGTFMSVPDRRPVQRIGADVPELTTAAIAKMVDDVVEGIHKLRPDVSAPPAAYDQAAAATLAAVEKRLEALEQLARDAGRRPADGPVLTDDVVEKLSTAMVEKLPTIATEAMVTVGTVSYTAEELLTLIAEIAEKAAAVELDRNLRALGMKSYDALVIEADSWESEPAQLPKTGGGQ